MAAWCVHSCAEEERVQLSAAQLGDPKVSTVRGHAQVFGVDRPGSCPTLVRCVRGRLSRERADAGSRVMEDEDYKAPFHSPVG